MNQTNRLFSYLNISIMSSFINKIKQITLYVNSTRKRWIKSNNSSLKLLYFVYNIFDFKLMVAIMACVAKENYNSILYNISHFCTLIFNNSLKLSNFNQLKTHQVIWSKEFYFHLWQLQYFVWIPCCNKIIWHERK